MCMWHGTDKELRSIHSAHSLNPRPAEASLHLAGLTQRPKCNRQRSNRMEFPHQQGSTIGLPFPVVSSHPKARRELQDCDYTKRYSLDEAREGNTERKIRVYCDGCFDLFHYGHMRVLFQAKYFLPNAYLIAGVSTDSQVRQCKGVSPIMTRQERLASVGMLSYVDELIEEPPVIASREFCKSYKIDFVAHDSVPYVSCLSPDETYEWAKEDGMLLETQRTVDISTTHLIGRIIDRQEELTDSRRQQHQ